MFKFPKIPFQTCPPDLTPIAKPRNSEIMAVNWKDASDTQHCTSQLRSINFQSFGEKLEVGKISFDTVSACFYFFINYQCKISLT